MKSRTTIWACLLLALTQMVQSTHFGIEFTATRVVCSASLSNGSTVTLSSVYGGDDYVEVMYRMFQERQSIGTQAITKQWAQNLLQQRTWLDIAWLGLLPVVEGARPIEEDEKTSSILGEAVAQARQECFKSLPLNYRGLTLLYGSQVVIAAPNFIFHPPKSHTLKLQESIQEEWETWHSKQLRILTRAVEKGGFKQNEVEIIPAAELALRWNAIGLDRSSIVLEFSTYGLSVWSEGHDQFWSIYSPTYWEESMRHGLPRLVEKLKGSDQEMVEVVLTGLHWSHARLRKLNRLIQDSGVDGKISLSVQKSHAAIEGSLKQRTIVALEKMARVLEARN